MTDEDRQKVNYVKAELNNYYHLKNKAIQLNFEADAILTKVNKVSSGSPAIIPSGKNEHNPHWRSPLYEELELLEQKIDNYLFRVTQVDNFLKKLQSDDRQMIWDLHVSQHDRKTYYNYCYRVYMSRRTLFRYVERLILKNWQ